MFKRIFGQGSGGGGGPGPKPSVTSTVRTVDAIQKLGETEELLVKRRSLLEKKIAQELEKAKEYTKAQNKRAALMALKKKKMYETQLEQCENNILRVNEQQMMLENQRTTVETVTALRDAAQASKSTMSEMKITDVDAVLDEINEQTDQMQQIQDAMAQPIGPAADMDEDELMGELENLESEQLDNQLLEPAPVPTARPAQAARPETATAMPSVPQGRPAQAAKPAKTQEELELEALEQEMAV
ncbi:g6360 [Coccomyxa elongata]